VIVTFNLSDFPADVLGRYGSEARHPDDFIASLLDLIPAGLRGGELPTGPSANRRWRGERAGHVRGLSLPRTAGRLRRVIELRAPDGKSVVICPRPLFFSLCPGGCERRASPAVAPRRPPMSFTSLANLLNHPEEEIRQWLFDPSRLSLDATCPR
jgi:hypothetical protein